MMDHDSGDEIFITQNTFRENSNFKTQSAGDAADFFDEKFWSDIDDHSFPEDVTYWDFSNQPDNSSDVPNTPEIVDMFGNKPEYVPLISDDYFGDDEKSNDGLVNETVSSMGTLHLVDGPTDRFHSPVLDAEVMEKSMKSYSRATRRKCNWAYKVFTDWFTQHKITANSDSKFDNIEGDLMKMTDEDLVYVMSRFILEVKKVNGQDYPSETLYEIVICLQLFMYINGCKVKFLDDDTFSVVRNCLDNRMKELSSDGIVHQHNQAIVISVEQENDMWERNILGGSNPKQLVDTILYLFRVHFALHAGTEHRSLRVGENSQITLHLENDLKFLQYKEDVSKTRQGGLDHCKIIPKKVRAYENVFQPEQCIVKLYEKYLGLRPSNIKNNDFYLCPLANPHANCWYTCQPIGRNTLSNVVSELAKRAGIQGKVTNHSLRATAASHLYNENMDEQLICEVTGHRSNAVRSYKCTSDNQRKCISNVLYGNNDENVKMETESPERKKRKVEIEPTSTTVQDLKGHISVSVNVNFK